MTDTKAEQQKFVNGNTKSSTSPRSDTRSKEPGEHEDEERRGSLLSVEYPTAQQWRDLLRQFDAKAIAHKLLLSHVPFVFRREPLKFALFRRTIADAFRVEPTNVFIVGSAMAGRSLKGRDIDKTYSPESDIDTLIVSEHLFAKYVMGSLEWVATVTKGERAQGSEKYNYPGMTSATFQHIGRIARNASQGIWRPDALPKGAEARESFFDLFSDVSLKTLGLQLSDDTVARVNGRVARSFDDAAANLAGSLRRLRYELESMDESDDDVAEEDVGL